MNASQGRCAMMIVVDMDAYGNDLCDSLMLPEYPMYQCHNAALEGSDMCREHDAWASHWSED